MIDLETLSLRPDAMIISAGIAIFNEQQVLETAGWGLDLAKTHGHIDMNTLKWWMDPEREPARAFSFNGIYSPDTFGFELKTMIARYNPTEFWANDPEFDMVVLKSWWQRQNDLTATNHRIVHLGDYPLNYKYSRSFRTIMAECERRGFDTKELRGLYVAHDPVEDAAAQARAVIQARRLLG